MPDGPKLLRTGVYDAIRTEILDCHLAPGQDMREQDLAERYNVSRQPVREALQRLSQEHLVTVQPRQGCRVTPVSVSDAKDILRFRLILEPACAADACEHASPETLAGLDEFRAFELWDRHEDFIAYNRAFHTALTAAGGHRRMAQAACELIEQSDRLVRVSLSRLGEIDPSQLVGEHCAIIDAVQARNGRLAGRLVRDHIAGGRKRILLALSRAAIVD